MADGIQRCAKLAMVTFGPFGRTVLYEQQGAVKVAGDGTEAVCLLEGADAAEEAGIRLARSVMEDCKRKLGVGATETVLIGSALLRQLRPYENLPQATLSKLWDGVHAGLLELAGWLQRYAVGRQCAAIAHMGLRERLRPFAAATELLLPEWLFDKDGVWLTPEVRSGEVLRLFREPGYFLSDVPLFPDFPKPSEQELLLSALLLTDRTLLHREEAISILEFVNQKRLPCIVVCGGMSEEIRRLFLTNVTAKGLPLFVHRAPEFGDRRKELLEDCSIMTGGAMLSKEQGSLFTEPLLAETTAGIACRVQAGGLFFRQQREHAAAGQARIKSLTAKKRAETEPVREEFYEKRLRQLLGGGVLLEVPGQCSGQLNGQQLSDALRHCLGVYHQGGVAGDGCFLEYAATHRRPQDGEGMRVIGSNCFWQAVRAPFRAMCLQAGESAEAVSQKLAAFGGRGAVNWLQGRIGMWSEYPVLEATGWILQICELGIWLASRCSAGDCISRR